MPANSIDLEHEVHQSRSLSSAYLSYVRFIENRLSDEHEEVESVQIFLHAVNRLEFYKRIEEVKGQMNLVALIGTAAGYGNDGFGWTFFNRLKEIAQDRDKKVFTLSTQRARTTFKELLTVGMYLSFTDICHERIGHTLH